MPEAEAWRPRKMFPPPITMAVWTPRSWTARISLAIRSRTLGSIPAPCAPARASPESFSRMRLYRGRPGSPCATLTPSSGAAGPIRSPPAAGTSVPDGTDAPAARLPRGPRPRGAEPSGRLLSDLESREAPHGDLLAGLGAHLRDQVLDPGLPGRIPDVRLLEEAGLLVELAELALDDLLEHRGRLLLVGHLSAIDLLLALDHVRGHVLPRHVARGRVMPRHLHGERLHQLLERLRSRHEIRLAVDLDEHPEL